jgi:DNA-binding response OmpR family regulator
VNSDITSVASGPAGSSHAAVRVLVVDDDPIIRQLLAECLRAAGMAVSEAANGVHCLRMAETETFDVIFMDIVMPEKDGIETTLELRKRGVKSWIIVISSQKKIGDTMLLDAAKSLGANDALQKPFNIATVARDVRSLLQKMNA